MLLRGGLLEGKVFSPKKTSQLSNVSRACTWKQALAVNTKPSLVPRKPWQPSIRGPGEDFWRAAHSTVCLPSEKKVNVWNEEAPSPFVQTRKRRGQKRRNDGSWTHFHRKLWSFSFYWHPLATSLNCHEMIFQYTIPTWLFQVLTNITSKQL